jgi:hypothetical protein
MCSVSRRRAPYMYYSRGINMSRKWDPYSEEIRIVNIVTAAVHQVRDKG